MGSRQYTLERFDEAPMVWFKTWGRGNLYNEPWNSQNVSANTFGDSGTH
jgi:hypothetical protein